MCYATSLALLTVGPGGSRIGPGGTQERGFNYRELPSDFGYIPCVLKQGRCTCLQGGRGVQFNLTCGMMMDGVPFV